MMRTLFQTVLALSVLLPQELSGAAKLVPDNVTVGQHLEIVANVALGEASPAFGVISVFLTNRAVQPILSACEMPR